MERIYKATVTIVFIAENEAEACDAVSAMLSENLMESGALLDWGYVKSENEFSTPTRTELDFPYTEGDYLNS